MITLTSAIDQVYQLFRNSAPDHYMEVVAKTFKNNLFHKFPQLHKSSLFKEESWLDLIEKIAKNKLDPKEHTYKTICYLISILVDPDIKDEEKQKLVAQALDPLNAYDLYDFSSKSLALPACMLLLILKFSDQHIWDNLIKYDYPRVLFFIVINEVLSNDWKKEEKQSFIDRVLDSIPKEISEDLVYSLLREHGDSFLNQCSQKSALYVTQLAEQVVKFGQSVIDDDSTLQTPSHIPFQGAQRLYFLHWFQKNITHKNAFLIALCFEESDWNYKLETKNGICSPITPFLAMQWVISVAKYIKGSTLKKTPPIAVAPSQVFHFFANASNHIQKVDGWKDVSESQIKEFIESISAKDLALYSGAFHKVLFKQVIKTLLTSQPEKFMQWIGHCLSRVETPDKPISQEIVKIFKAIEKKDLSTAISSIYGSKEIRAEFQLEILCYLDSETQKQIVRFCLVNREEGITKIALWIKVCLPSSTQVKKSVVSWFSKRICQLIQECDFSIVEPLKKQILSEIHSEEDQAFVDDVFPGVDLTNTSIRHERALEKLEGYFLQANVPYLTRRSYVESVSADLFLEDSSIWLPKLFKQLPKKAWPLLFLYFPNFISRLYFNPIHLRKRGKELWIQDSDKWINLASEILLQMDKNPLLHVEESQQAMNALYREICECNTLDRVIIRIIENESNRSFISIMNKLALAAYPHNPREFDGTISKCLDMAKVNKVMFIATHLLAYFDAWQTCTLLKPDLATSFWTKPFLKASELASVAKTMISVKEAQFIELVQNDDFPTSSVLKVLEQEDHEYCENLFFMCIRVLVKIEQVAATDTWKLYIFFKLHSSYESLGYNPVSLLSNEKMKEFILIIMKWQKQSSKVNLALLAIFNFDEFLKQVLPIIKAILTEKDVYKFKSLFDIVERTGKKTEVIIGLRKDPELRKLLKEAIESDIIGWFFCQNSISIPEFLPNWQLLLANAVKENMKKEKEKYASIKDKPTYGELVTLYTSLEQFNLLNDWRKTLPFDDTEVYTAYEKQKKKDANDKKEDP